jgi:outer membrane lipoprotein SlyB
MKGMNSVFKRVVAMLASLTLVACTSSAPRLAVDPASIQDQATYDKDYGSCVDLAKTIDISDEKLMKAIGGAAIGTAAVAGIATAVAGAVFAPAIPFMVAGGLAGGGLWGSSASKEEKQAREGVLIGCLRDKGYKVYGAQGL